MLAAMHARLVLGGLFSMALWMMSCVPAPPSRGKLPTYTGGSPGQGGAAADIVDGDPDGVSSGGYRGIQSVKPGTPYMCKRKLYAEHEVMRELEFGVGKGDIRRCYESYIRSDRIKTRAGGVLQLTVIIDRGGKIADARASAFDYWLEDCVERAVTLNCVGQIMGDDGLPQRREFTLEMYLQQ